MTSDICTESQESFHTGLNVSFQTEREERAEKLIRELHGHKLTKEVRIVHNYVVLIDTREIQSKGPMG